MPSFFPYFCIVIRLRSLQSTSPWAMSDAFCLFGQNAHAEHRIYNTMKSDASAGARKLLF
jgi:hypothetical protein